MDEQAIGNLITQVDESYIRVIYANQCSKAQSLLNDKLKKQIEHLRETCASISSANLKLQSEIVEAQNIINSMLIAQETINKANVELKKELLLTIQKKNDLIQRIETGEKKYEALWLECKKRYESIPRVQKLINANKRLEDIKKDIIKLDETSLKLAEEIDTKTKNCADIDKKRAIELSVFIVRDLPKYNKIIQEKTKAIAELSEKIRKFETKVPRDVKIQTNSKTAVDSEWPMLKNDDIVTMPTLDLPNNSLDFDALTVKSDTATIKNTNTDLNAEAKEAFAKTRLEINMFKSNDKDGLISLYFPKLNQKAKEKENYSKKKLINILQDVKLNKDDAVKLISKVNRDYLEPVEAIGAEVMNTKMIQNSSMLSLDNKSNEPIQSEEIEEIDLTSKSDNILNPPSPFLDMSTTIIITEDDQEVDEEEELVNSPKENSIVTSKFFENNNNNENNTDIIETEPKKDEEPADKPDGTANLEGNEPEQIVQGIINMELNGNDDDAVTSPKRPKLMDDTQSRKPISGLIFNHGPHGLPESLDLSFSTTGYEDGDNNIPHCIDSSVLLSPKANLPSPSGDSTDIPQEEPNFLLGLRKTGLSFFGMLPTKESKPDTNTTENAGTSSGFTFNFKSKDEKKTRGGLFSMFQ